MEKVTFTAQAHLRKSRVLTPFFLLHTTLVSLACEDGTSPVKEAFLTLSPTTNFGFLQTESL